MCLGSVPECKDMSIIYNIVFIVFAIIYIPIFLFKKRKREGLRLRFGIYPKHLIKSLESKQNIWIHAVSVGEVRAVSALIDKIRDHYKDHRVVITTVTETGNSLAKKIAKDDDIVLYLPFDISFIMKRVFNYIKPSTLIIAETEIWPNLISQAYSRDIPIYLVNGRISDKSFYKYKLISLLLKPLFRKFNLLLMQSDLNKERIISLGADSEKVKNTGNVKFDSAIAIGIPESEKEELRSLLGLKDNDLFVAGSTHPNEEEILIRAYKKLRMSFSNIRLLLAPRHIERTEEIEGLIKRLGFVPIRFSDLDANPAYWHLPDGSQGQALSANNIIILDTIGSLRKVYSISKVVFVGGSLIKKGGQNMIEPAAFGKPVIFGPFIFNFQDITEIFLKKRGAVSVSGLEDLVEKLNLILSDKDFSDKLSSNALEVVKSNIGATQETFKFISQ